jgi:hypothetical protein
MLTSCAPSCGRPTPDALVNTSAPCPCGHLSPLPRVPLVCYQDFVCLVPALTGTLRLIRVVWYGIPCDANAEG